MISRQITTGNYPNVPSEWDFLLRGNCWARYQHNIQLNTNFGFRDAVVEAFFRDTVTPDSTSIPPGVIPIDVQLPLIAGPVDSGPQPITGRSGLINLLGYARTRRIDGISHPETEYPYRQTAFVTDYNRPLLNFSPIFRVDTTSGSASDTGTAFNNFFTITAFTVLYNGSNANNITSISVGIRRSGTSDPWVSCQSQVVAGNTIWIPQSGFAINSDLSYEVQVETSDRVSNAVNRTVLTPASCLIFFREDGLGVGLGTSDVPPNTVNIKSDWQLQQNGFSFFGSLAEYKVGIKPYSNASAIIRRTQIYSYYYKGKDGRATGTRKYGPVIGRGCPNEIIADGDKELRLMSFCGLLCGALQEQMELTESLARRVQALEKEFDTS